MNLVALVALLAERGKANAAVRIADRLAGYFYIRSNAIDWLVAATAARRAADDDAPDAVVSAELHLGMVRYMQARYDAAAGHFAECARRARRAGWAAAEAVGLNNLASAYWALGRAADTITELTGALDVHRRSGRTVGEAVTLANIAAARLDLARSAEAGAEPTAAAENRREALRLLGQAREMHQATGDRQNEAETCRLLAEAYRDHGELRTATGHAHRAIRLARKAEAQRFEISARSTLATVLVRLGEAERGLAEHKRAQDLAAEKGDLAQRVQVLLDLAESLARLGRPEEALPAAQDASAAAPPPPHASPATPSTACHRHHARPAATSTAVSWPGRLRQIHAFFRAHSPDQMLSPGISSEDYRPVNTSSSPACGRVAVREIRRSG